MKQTHFRYLTDKHSVCMEPERLIDDFIMGEGDMVTCRECMALVNAVNNDALAADLAGTHNSKINERRRADVLNPLILALSVGVLFLSIAALVVCMETYL